MQITRRSPVTGIENTMEIPVTQEQIDNWQGGMLIQNAMPNLSADQHEFIMTGMTAEDWDNTFKDNDD